MTASNPTRLESLALGILEFEAAGCGAAVDLAAAIERTFGTLESLMCTLVGPVGFRALLGRAAQLVRTEFPWINAADIESDASLSIRGGGRRRKSGPEEGRARVTALVHIKGLKDVIEREGRAPVFSGAAALLATVVQLLCDFIGEDLTFRLLHRAWPKAAFDGRRSGSEEG